MPHRDTPWPAGTPCWADVVVPDVPAASAFYGTVLGWELEDMGEQFGHYTMARYGGRDAAALSPPMDPSQPATWTVYIATEDVDATVKLVTENGGAVVAPAMDVPDNGRMAIVTDPTGGVVGLWQASGMIGCQIYNEVGGMMWEDARFTDPTAGQEFYAAVFGHTFEPVPGAPDDYVTFHAGGDPLGGMGGMMGAPEGTPSHWLPYFGVADVDAAAEAARAGGGRVLMEPETTTYGRMAVLTDPFGATFAVHGGMGTA